MSAADVFANHLGERLGGDPATNELLSNIGPSHPEGDFDETYKDKLKLKHTDNENLKSIVDQLLRPLDAKEIIDCRYKIGKMQPLAKLPFSEAFPTLCCCIPQRDPSDEECF